MYVCVCIYIYIYIYRRDSSMYLQHWFLTKELLLGLEPLCLLLSAPNLPTNFVDFQGFDSSIILI